MSMIQMNQSHDIEASTLKLRENQKKMSKQSLQSVILPHLPFLKNGANLADKTIIDVESKSQDSAVSFEQNILDQHLQCTIFEIQHLTSLLFEIVSFDLLQHCRQLQPYTERPTLKIYLQQAISLIKQQEVPFFMSLLASSPNPYKFLQEVFESSSELLAHELVFISFHAFKTFTSIKGWLYTISQLRQLSSNHQFLKIICDHQELKLLSYQKVFGTRVTYQDGLRQKVQEFLYFYLFTCLLVQENYFVNPHYQKIVKRIEKQKKVKKGINRIRFEDRKRKEKKIVKQNNNK